MLDGMIWRCDARPGLTEFLLMSCRSRVVVHGNRRVNYYLKHLLVATRKALLLLLSVV